MPKLDRILTDIEYKHTDTLPLEINSITSDSRDVNSGSLFFALKGTKDDGHAYLEDAAKKGATAAVVEGKQPRFDIPQIIVKDSRKALAVAAANYYDNPSEKLDIIGITGTNGKTSTVYLLNKILEQAEIPAGTIGTLGYSIRGEHHNSKLTTPDIIQLNKILKKMVENGVEVTVMEVSSHALAMGRVNSIKFKGACFTNLSEDHLDFHNTMEEYAQTKAKLFTRVDSDGFSISNLDDDHADIFIDKAQGDLYTTSSYNTDADYYWSKDTKYHNTIEGELNTPKDKFTLTSPLTGIFSLKNITSAIAIADNLNISKESIKKGINTADHIPGRMQEVEISSGPRVFVDYAHTPAAIENVLQELNQIQSNSSLLYVVFGCGGDREREKRPLMAQNVEKYADRAILTMDNPRTEDPDQIFQDAVKGFSENNSYRIIKDRKEAIYEALNRSSTADIIAILGKGHENYQIIKDKKRPFDDVKVVKNWFKDYGNK